MAVSTKLAGFFFAFEMLVLVVVSVAAIIKNGAHLSTVPFQLQPHHQRSCGLAAGFPLAIYLFIGWENSAALAEETGNPRRNVPRAVFLSIAMMGVGYVLFAYATVTGFNLANGAALAAAPILLRSRSPTTSWAGPSAVFAYLAGLRPPPWACLISAINSLRLADLQRRLGAWLLSSCSARCNLTRQTSVNALLAFTAIGGAIIVVCRCSVTSSAATRQVRTRWNFFVESSTMGTILILVVYFLANLALPFYYRKYERQDFSIVKHVILPALGMIAIAVPVYYLTKPGQPQPYNWFPWAALAIVVVSAAVYASLSSTGATPASASGPASDHRRRAGFAACRSGDDVLGVEVAERPGERHPGA